MDTRNGNILTEEAVKQLLESERKFFVPVVRDLSKIELAEAQIHKYSPCGCGSGKKFKFCCLLKK